MTSTDLALRNADPLTIAAKLYESGLFADTKSEAQAIVKVLAGQEYGLQPFAAMRGIHIIQGQPVPGAHVLAQAIKRSGHYTFKVKEHTNTGCSLEFFQKTPDGWESLGVESYTLDDAKRAGLMGKANYQKHPRNMFFARCVSNGARFHCPDITGGPILTYEELEDGGDAPTPVPNEAETWQMDEVARKDLSEWYVKSGWWEQNAEDGIDPHARIRMQLAAVGADNGVVAEGDPAPLVACLAKLTEEQYEMVKAALVEAAMAKIGAKAEA